MFDIDEIDMDEEEELLFRKKFGRVFRNVASYGRACYESNKTKKSYYLDDLTLTGERATSLMKKSLASGHDYLLDAVKDNECPPYDPDCIY